MHTQTQKRCEVLSQTLWPPIICSPGWSRKWVARSPEMMLCWQIMSTAYLCWAVLHCQKYPFCNTFTSTAQGKARNSREAQSKRGVRVDETSLNSHRSLDLAWSTRHVRDGGGSRVVLASQTPNIFCIGLTSHWFLFYFLPIFVTLSVLQMHICVPSTSAVYITYHKLRANRNLTKKTPNNKKASTWWTLVLLVGLRIAVLTSNLSACFYFHARKGKGNFSPPTDTKAELPCHHALSCTEAWTILVVEQPFVISVKELVESICCYLSGQFSFTDRIKSYHFNLLEAGTVSSLNSHSQIMELRKGRYPKAQEPTF